ncbi:hypothetical protein [Brevibacillus invocatus]|uniref:hypothetical protein n=1 Tax=Brevibacillus invocatus TaxID=173959 RepID=UPI002041B2E4|nr:hypothetical protein [Brevibacillus invocatus]MCM3082144.1 hypothetical protein [Brevibacillus invocatus]MCM3432562.1 hypothetical protein [Brevibacillus invocatus]
MYRIAYIDDEPNVVRQFQANMDDDFDVIDIELKENIEEMIEEIIDSRVSAVVIDYNLNSSHATIHYNGVHLLRHLLNRMKDFPAYILTSHEAEAEGTLLDPDLIRDKKFVSEQRAWFVHKLKTKIESHDKQMELYRKELASLAARFSELTSREEERLIELDDILEKNSNGYKALPSDVKKLSNDARLDRLINLSEQLIEELRNADGK